jgi:FlaA1/EpsC-like NDP-sugar epimerase
MKKRITDYWMHRFLPRGVVLGMDLIIVGVTFALTYFLRFNLEWIHVDIGSMYMQMGLVSIVYLLMFLLFKPFSGIIRHTTFHDGMQIIKSTVAATALLLVFSSLLRTFPATRFICDRGLHFYR